MSNRAPTAARSAGTLVILIALACRAPAQTVAGPVCAGDLLISEVHHPAQTTSGGSAPILPFRYLEIMSRRMTVAAPRNISGGTLTLISPGGTGTVVTQLIFPPGTAIPEPTIDPGSGTLIPGVLVVTSTSIPALIGPSPLGGTRQIVAPGLFNASTGGPGQDLRVLLRGPSTTPGGSDVGDELIVGANPGGPPPLFGAAGTPLVDNSTGHVNRVLYVRSCTLYDYETVEGENSPGTVNPRLDFIGGFSMGTGPSGVGFPLVAVMPTGTAFQGSVVLSGTPISGIRTPNHPQFPEIQDPAFDRTLQVGTVNGGSNLNFTSTQLANPASLTPFTWNLTVPPVNTTSPGSLQIDLGPLFQGAVEVILPAVITPGIPAYAIRRALTDGSSTDATISGTGELTEVQIDVLRTSGDTWCELILYDGGGYSYQAKVRNWPADPQNCNDPKIGLGTNGLGSLDLVTLCFTPQAELYILPTLVTTPVTGTGPFFGVNPDLFTWMALSQPLGIEPFHVTADNDGLYFYSFPFNLPVGLSIDWAAVEYDAAAGGFTQFAPPATITL